MHKINWPQKLSSRKFWMAFGSFLTAILAASGMAENQIAQVSAIVAAFGSVVVYVLAETSVDVARIKAAEEKPPDVLADAVGFAVDDYVDEE